jgi:hypothetical protein
VQPSASGAISSARFATAGESVTPIARICSSSADMAPWAVDACHSWAACPRGAVALAATCQGRLHPGPTAGADYSLQLV